MVGATFLLQRKQNHTKNLLKLKKSPWLALLWLKNCMINASHFSFNKSLVIESFWKIHAVWLWPLGVCLQRSLNASSSVNMSCRVKVFELTLTFVAFTVTGLMGWLCNSYFCDRFSPQIFYLHPKVPQILFISNHARSLLFKFWLCKLSHVLCLIWIYQPLCVLLYRWLICLDFNCSVLHFYCFLPVLQSPPAFAVAVRFSFFPFLKCAALEKSPLPEQTDPAWAS